MDSIDMNVLSSVISWMDAHGGVWVWAAGAALILLIVSLPLLFKLKGRHQVQQGVNKLKKDLMVWDNLSNLAKGGEKGDQEREKLTVNTRLIYELFAEGLKDLKKAHYPSDHPWFVVVGEPRGGKSELLQSEDLELMSASGSGSDDKHGQDVPVRFFSGNLGSVLDVNGRIFFDRWMGGSSAEWLTLLKLIRKHHKKLPLSGVVLVIPADALLADDRALTRRKAHLIAMELDQLTRVLSMEMPCHVVITKMDEVSGFRKYFNEIDESMRRKIFGWQTEAKHPWYDRERFNEFWNTTLERLREGVKTLMVSRSVIGALAESPNRMDSAGEIFLFPENFNELKENLEIYLEEVFSQSSQSYRQLLLEGVFFTSAKDGGVAYNKQFAAAVGKSIDDAPMQSLSGAHSKTFFIRDLFVQWILGAPSRARFTRSEIIRRHIPAYLVMLLLLASSVQWLTAVYWDTPSLKDRMTRLEGQIANVTKLFADDDVAKGSLISPSAQTTFTLPMPGMPQTSRLNFFMEELSRLYATERVPLGYFASGYILFGRYLDIGRDTRRFLFNEIQSDMAFLPTVTALGNNLITTRNEPFTVVKRNAVAEYLTISFYREKLGWTRHDTNELYDPTTMRSFLNYLLPGMSQDMITVLGTFDPSNDKSADVLNTEVVNNVLYRRASAAGAEQWIKAWQDIDIYPNTDYVKMRTAIGLAVQLSDRYHWLVKAANNPTVTINEWDSNIERAKTILSVITDEDLEILEKLFRFVPTEKKGGKDKKETTESSKAKNALLGGALASYESRLKEDFVILKHFSKHRSQENVSSQVNTLLSPDGLDKSEAEIREKLDLQLADLEKNLAVLRMSPLFKIKESDNAKGGDFASELRLLRELLDTATGPSATRTLEKPSQIEAVWMTEADFFDNKKAMISSLVKKHNAYEVAAQLGDSMIQMVDREQMSRLVQVAEEGLDLYPMGDSASALVSAFRTQAAKMGDAETTALPDKYQGFDEILGPVSLRNMYTTQVLEEIIEPLAFLDRQLQPMTKNKFADKVKTLLRSERWKSLIAADSQFSREFIRYWGAFGDNLKPQTTNWKTFRDFAEKSRAYEINTDLLAIYDLASDMISKTSKNILDEETVKERDDAIALIGQRRKMLNLQYTESCVQTLASWASLPMSPLQAYRTVQSMPAAEMRSTLLLATGKNAVPWWNAFVDEGTRFLKLGARSGAASQLNSLSGELNRFPLTATQSEKLTPISSAEMRVLASKLGHDAPTPVSEAAEAKAEAPDAATPALQQKITVSTPALKGKLSLIDKLALAEQPVYWTMVLPDAAMQQQLTKRYGTRLPNAVARYRYISVATAAGKSPLQSSAGGKQAVIIGDGDLENGEAQVDFYQFSDSAKPSASVNFDGQWAMLKPYLGARVIADKDKKTWWIPLIVKDALDESSIFFVGLQFSDQLPKPTDWPR